MNELSNNNNSEAVMKQKILVGALSVEALVCVLFCILQTSFTGVFSAVMAFPFEQIGMGLRSLSLSSGLVTQRLS